MESNIARKTAHLERTGLTKAGAAWLTLVTDPFHDVTLDHVGYPDSNENLSVISCCQSELAISAPPGSSGTWSALVTTWPESNAGQGTSNTVSLLDTTTSSNQIASTGEGAGLLGPCSVYSFEEGIGGFNEALPTLNTSLNVDAWIVSAGLAHWNAQNVIANQMEQLTTAPFRRIASGFEVHNVTPELYLSGSVCVGRTSQTRTLEEKLTYNNKEVALEQSGLTRVGKLNSRFVMEDHRFARHTNGQKFGATTYAKERCLVMEGQMPPATMALARSRPDSLLWEAKKGCLCVDTMIDENNEPSAERCLDHVFKNKDQASLGTAIGYQHIVGASAAGNDSVSVTHPDDFNSSWAFFSGLSHETVLRVTSKVYYEVFPSTFESLLAGLASPSPPYDPKALAVYFRVARRMPPGVPVGQNAHGDWWRKMLGLIDVAAPIISAVPGYGPLISEGLTLGSRVGKAYGPAIQSAVDKALARRKARRAKNKKR